METGSTRRIIDDTKKTRVDNVLPVSMLRKMSNRVMQDHQV